MKQLLVPRAGQFGTLLRHLQLFVLHLQFNPVDAQILKQTVQARHFPLNGVSLLRQFAQSLFGPLAQ